ncbi:MAG: hypothetical protein L6Q49_22090 [Anaerolineales bacterium]|nr:hypothetical protein [Anaerolineales bacterium]
MKQSNIKIKTIFALLVSVALALTGFRPVLAQAATCVVAETSTEEVIAGVTLTWDSAFHCPNSPETGDYSITVNVQSDGASTESVVLESIELLITPLPGGEAPEATAEASGLPLTVAPGASGSFGISGTAELTQTDEGMKANLHLRVSGVGGTTNTPLQLGVNIILNEGEVDDDDPEDPGEPGDGPATGFFCMQSEVQHPFGALLAERYSMDYATLQAWFCGGYGWGQIMLALQTGMITGGDPAALLEQRNSGLGWGEIWLDLGLIGPSANGNGNGPGKENGNAGPPNDENGDGIPDFAGPPNDENDDGIPDFAGPPNDENGDGIPDFAGPPNDEDGDGKPDFAGPPPGRGGDDDDNDD